MTTREAPTIPPIPAPVKGSHGLVLDVGTTHRLFFALGDRMPSESQLFGMRRHIESEFRRYGYEYGETFTDGDLAWRWVR